MDLGPKKSFKKCVHPPVNCLVEKKWAKNGGNFEEVFEQVCKMYYINASFTLNDVDSDCDVAKLGSLYFCGTVHSRRSTTSLTQSRKWVVNPITKAASDCKSVLLYFSTRIVGETTVRNSHTFFLSDICNKTLWAEWSAPVYDVTWSGGRGEEPPNCGYDFVPGEWINE